MPTVQNVLTASCAQDAALLDGPSTSGKCAQLRSFAKKSAHQIRNGDTLLIDDSISRVSSFYWNHGKARGGGSISCDLVDVRTGAKTSARLKNDDQVETAELRTQSFQVLYTEAGKNDAGTVHLMDPQTFEQVAVPCEIFGSASRWLLPDMQVDLKFLGEEEQPVTGLVPLKLKLKVIEARPALPRTDGTTNRHVVVEGGASIMVPGHIQEGDSIVVNTANGTYDSKVL